MSQGLRATAKFGADVEAFLLTPLGEFMKNKAESEIDAAVEELKTVHPLNSEKIREIQTRIQIAERVLYWFGDAIREGRMAEEQLQFIERA